MRFFEYIKNNKLILSVSLLFVIGWFVGSGTFTFFEAKGLSYFSNSPEACKNCHSMNQVYDRWVNSGHRHVAVCNDCHAPQDFVGKWMTKAANGFSHSKAFTFDKTLPVTFQATDSQKKIANDNCKRCHTDLASHAIGYSQNIASLECISCHRNPGH